MRSASSRRARGPREVAHELRRFGQGAQRPRDLRMARPEQSSGQRHGALEHVQGGPLVAVPLELQAVRASRRRWCRDGPPRRSRIATARAASARAASSCDRRSCSRPRIVSVRAVPGPPSCSEPARGSRGCGRAPPGPPRTASARCRSARRRRDRRRRRSLAPSASWIRSARVSAAALCANSADSKRAWPSSRRLTPCSRVRASRPFAAAAPGPGPASVGSAPRPFRIRASTSSWRAASSSGLRQRRPPTRRERSPRPRPPRSGRRRAGRGRPRHRLLPPPDTPSARRRRDRRCLPQRYLAARRPIATR